MKTIIVILNLACVLLICFFFYNLSTGNAITFTSVVVVFYLIFAPSVRGALLEADSFKNPKRVSRRDVGRVIKIKELKDGRVGVVSWGIKNKGMGEITDHKDYYWGYSFPINFCKVGDIVSIKEIEGKIVFKIVKFYATKKGL